MGHVTKMVLSMPFRVTSLPTFASVSNHESYMKRCLELAALGIGKVAPNPMVGCVIVHNDKIIGEGYHQQYGQAHAEVNAINAVQDKSLLTESTLYVNLEPCAHHGKTPPCADLIVQHKLKHVVICNRDPFAEVDGKGIAKLEAAGITVETGILAPEGLWLNRIFFTFHTKKRPYIILKWAQTIDGFIDRDRAPGDHQPPLKITCDESNRLVHKWRTEEAAILVGKNTALLDDPRLTARHWPGKNPLRLVIDPQLQLPSTLRMFNDENETWVFNARKAYCEKNICFEQINDPSEFPHEIAEHLYKKGIQSVIIEGGKNTLEHFYSAGLWDEARIFTNPMRIGGGIAAPRFTGKEVSREHIGEDILQVYIPG